MYIVYEGGEGTVTEKKSRFLSAVQPVHSEEEALAFVAAARKRYWDASHHCYAYVLGDRQELQRCSDDGEPSGTAGRPILDVLAGAGISGAICVVTRYFGGTLLGTGGLVRAYSSAAQEGLRASRVLEKKAGYRFWIQADYADLGRLQYLLAQRDIPVMESVYAGEVRLRVIVSKEKKDALCGQITDATGARAVFSAMEEIVYAQGEEQPILL